MQAEDQGNTGTIDNPPPASPELATLHAQLHALAWRIEEARLRGDVAAFEGLHAESEQLGRKIDELSAAAAS